MIATEDPIPVRTRTEALDWIERDAREIERARERRNQAVTIARRLGASTREIAHAARCTPRYVAYLLAGERR